MSICSLTKLNHLLLDINQISCFPSCLSFVATNNYVTLPYCTRSNSIIAICDIIASTNIQNIKTEWSCDPYGYTNSNPCLSGFLWAGITCIGINITEINFYNFGVTGIFISVYFQYTTYY